jgi:hypothetical protein
MKTIISKVINNRVSIFLQCVDSEADSQLIKVRETLPEAFIYDGPYSPELWVDGNIVSVFELSEPIKIPNTVTMRQARLALLGAGLLDNVNTAINSLPSPQKEAAQIEWEYSQEVHRNKELVVMLLPALGMTEAQADQLFIAAAQL